MSEEPDTKLMCRLKNLDDIISKGAEHVGTDVIASILPPAIKYFQLKTCNLKRHEITSTVSILFPYSPHSRIMAIRNQNTGRASQHDELDMSSLDLKKESGYNQKLAGLELHYSLDLDIPDDCGYSMSDVSMGGLIKRVIEKVSIDGGGQTSRMFLALKSDSDDGVLIESGAGMSSIPVDNESGFSIATPFNQNAYKVEGGKIKYKVSYKDANSLSELVGYFLNRSSRNRRLVSAKAYLNGEEVVFTDLLKDMREWYTNTPE